MTMQRYNIDRDGDLKKAENGYVYLASEVDALLAQRTADVAAMLVDKTARIAELEKAISFAISEIPAPDVREKLRRLIGE